MKNSTASHAGLERRAATVETNPVLEGAMRQLGRTLFVGWFGLVCFALVLKLSSIASLSAFALVLFEAGVLFFIWYVSTWRLAHWLLFAMVACFVGYHVWNLSDSSCKCFGQLGIDRGDLICFEVFSLLLMLGSASCFKGTELFVSKTRAAVLACVLSLGAFLLANSLPNTISGIYEADGLAYHLTESNKSRFGKGNWTFLFFAKDCEHCQEYISQLETDAEQESVILVEVNGESWDTAMFPNEFVCFRLESSVLLRGALPQTARICDGKIGSVNLKERKAHSDATSNPGHSTPLLKKLSEIPNEQSSF